MKDRKVKATAYLSRAALGLLACAPDTAGVGWAINALADLLGKAGRKLAQQLGRAEWEILYQSLWRECGDTPAPGESWGDFVRFAVDRYAENSYLGSMADSEVSAGVSPELCAALVALTEVEALAILASVRARREADFAKVGMPPEWWEPGHRVRLEGMPLKSRKLK